MKNIKKTIAVLALASQVVLVTSSFKANAQQTTQSPAKEHLEYCVSQLTVKVAQAQAIKGVMQQQNLSKVQKLEQVGKILTPEQKQQLKTCMEQTSHNH